MCFAPKQWEKGKGGGVLIPNFIKKTILEKIFLFPLYCVFVLLALLGKGECRMFN